MAKARLKWKLLAGCVLLLEGAGPALAQATPEQILQFRPVQSGISITTPTAAELAGCKVEVFKGTRQGSTGYVLYDAKRQPLRRFFDSNGDRKVDLWSYFKDGTEVYREIDSNFNGTADQFRWLGDAGMKWGVDVNEDGKIDSWKMISAEEVAQEAFLAVATKDAKRLQALFITDGELKAIKLPAALDQQIRETLTKAGAQFAKAQTDFPNLTEKSTFERVESAVPSCIAADITSAEQDVIKYPSRVILYKGADNQHDFLHSGGMIQVGMAWRLIDAPGKGDVGGDTKTTDKVLLQLQEKLAEYDKLPVPPSLSPGPNKDLHAYALGRVAILEKIVAHPSTEERDSWIRQLADSLSTAAQSAPKGDKNSSSRLGQLRDQVAAKVPGSTLAGYVAYRHLWSEFSVRLIEENTPKTQEQWLDACSKFVQQHPKAEDAPDALMHLIMGCEFAGKDEEAKRWCQQMVTNFPEHAQAAKTRGIERRLNLVGNKLELAAPVLNGGGAFNITNMGGKVVVVYYWESSVRACIGDFAQLKQLHQAYGAKGLEVVTVNLDDQAASAQKFVSANHLPVTHLFQTATGQTGLNSPLATQYGIMGLPTVFLVGRDGRVINRSLQINDLEDALKKAMP